MVTIDTTTTTTGSSPNFATPRCRCRTMQATGGSAATTDHQALSRQGEGRTQCAAGF
jgi:hypothetical protein